MTFQDWLTRVARADFTRLTLQYVTAVQFFALSDAETELLAMFVYEAGLP